MDGTGKNRQFVAKAARLESRVAFCFKFDDPADSFLTAPKRKE